MASWSDIEPEENLAAVSPEENKKQKKDLSLDISSRGDEFRLIHLKKCFSKCDKDSDGFIDSRELRKLCVSLDLPQFASGESAAALFKALDVSSSGRIAFRDFLRYKDIYLKTAQAMEDRVPDTIGSLSPSSTVTSSSYQEADISLDSEVEVGHTTFESPGPVIRILPLGTSDSSESPDKSDAGVSGLAPAKVEKRRIRPNSAGLTDSAATRRTRRPSSAETREADVTLSNPGVSLRAQSYTYLNSSSNKEEGMKSISSRKRSSSSGYIHQLLSLHQHVPGEEGRDGDRDNAQEKFTTSTPIRSQLPRSRRQFYTFDSPVIKPSLAPSSLPLEALPSSPVTVLHSICEEGSDHANMSQLLELFQVLGFDRNDVSEDLERVLQEVPRDGEGGLSVIGVARVMERILAGEEEVQEGSLLRQLSLKLYQQEIVAWRTHYQTSVNERNQLLDNLEYHRGEQRRLLIWGDEQAEIEALHWDRKLRDTEHKLRNKLRSLEENKRDELENILEKTAKEIDEREKSIKRLQGESEHLRESVRDLKADKDYLTHHLEDSKNRVLVSERLIDGLQLQLEESQGLSYLTDLSQYGDKTSDLDRVIGERNQLLESNKTLQDSNDEITAENQKIQQQLRMTQNRYKQAVKSLSGRPASGKTRASPLVPRSRHSKSLVEPPQVEVEGEASPTPERRTNLMGEMIEHDLQTMEKQRMSHLEVLNSKLEQRIEELETSIRQMDSRLFDTERERERERQKRKKEEKTLNSNLADLESDNIQLRELRLGAEERLRDLQSDISKKFVEINELNKELSSLTHKLTELELKNESLTTQNKSLEESVKNTELSEQSISVDKSALRKQVQELQFELSTSKSVYELKLCELNRLLTEAEALTGRETSRLTLEKDGEIKRVQQAVEAANRTVVELKRVHKEVATELEGRVEHLEKSLADVTEKYTSEVESMKEEFLNAAEKDRVIREAKLALELELTESLNQLGEVTKSRDSGDRVRVEMSDNLDRIKSERELIEGQFRAELASLSSKLHSTHGELSGKLRQSEASHKQVLTEVRNEYESQIEKLHQEMRSLDQTALSARDRLEQEITGLSLQLSRAQKEVSGLVEATKGNAELEKEFESVWLELESLKAEKDKENEAHFDEITDFKDNIESLEAELRELSLQAELERSELEESIKGYEEHEKLLVAEFEERLSQLQAKFEQEIVDRSLDDDNYVAEIERLMFELNESKEEMDLIRDDSFKQVQVLREEELAAVSALNEFKKSKEVEITKLRNTLIEQEYRVKYLSKTNETNKFVLLDRSSELESAGSELLSTRKARQLLEMQLETNRKALEVARQLQTKTRKDLEERVRELEIKIREAEMGRETSLTELESSFSSQVRELKTEIENRQAEVRMLKMRLIEADSVRAGEELNAEWKSHFQELNSQILELERQLRSRDAILDQVRKERREAQEIKLHISLLLEEKEALLYIIEKISYLVVAH